MIQISFAHVMSTVSQAVYNHGRGLEYERAVIIFRQKAAVDGLACSSGKTDTGVSVYLIHLLGLCSPVLVIVCVLHNTEGINPKVANAQLSCKDSCVLKRLGEDMIWNIFQKPLEIRLC